MAVSARNFFTAEEQEEIRQAIEKAELDTSGEIRVHVENKCKGEVLDRAAYLFKKLGMHNTHHRNGVLIYLALQNRKFAIIGDTGIHKNVPENFWEDIKQTMSGYFLRKEFCDGLCYAVTATGEQLKKHFPFQVGDGNELPDDISFGK
ncbi:MAG TPA: TPM domain-containing protein [Bacteroidales bacterium]|nr:TPM domain-containing protein [Bacteroidales bacterium]